MLNKCCTTVTAVMEMLDAYEHCNGGGDRGNGYWWLVWLSSVLVSVLHKDLVMERPPKTYSVALSYMALT